MKVTVQEDDQLTCFFIKGENDHPVHDIPDEEWELLEKADEIGSVLHYAAAAMIDKKPEKYAEQIAKLRNLLGNQSPK